MVLKSCRIAGALDWFCPLRKLLLMYSYVFIFCRRVARGGLREVSHLTSAFKFTHTQIMVWSDYYLN